MATIQALEAKDAWELTLDEYKQTPQGRQVENAGGLAVNLDAETAGSMQRFSGVELSALARLYGARRKGKKSVLIARIFSRHHVRKALASETAESLLALKVVALNDLLKKAGLPTSYGDKKTKAQKLIDWRDEMQKTVPDRLAESKHFLFVHDAIIVRQYHKAIAKGHMTVERATAIIRSAGLNVPEDLHLPQKETKRKGGRATRALENAEIRALFSSIDGRYAVRNRAMLMVGIHLALRASELCGLTVGDVYDGEKVRTYITIRGEIAKGGKQRTIRMSSDVRAALDAFIKWKAGQNQFISADAPLFVSQMGGHLSRKTLFTITSDLLRGAGIDQSPHGLRKTGATIYYTESDFDVVATQHFLGHADPSTTRDYIGITPQQTVSYSEKSGKQLLAAIETGEMEKLDTLTHMSHFPNLGLSDEGLKHLQSELERKDQIIDRLLALTEEYDLPVDRKAIANSEKVITLNLARRRRSR